MQDPKWIGSSPGRVFWSEDGKWIYFWWNPEQAESDSLYVVSRNGGTPRKVTIAEQLKLPAQRGEYNRQRTKKLYEKNGDIFLMVIKSGQVQQVTNTLDRESSPHFTYSERKITFMRDNNLFLWKMDDGATIQLTDFRKGREKPDQHKPGSQREKWLQQEELKLIHVLRERKEKEKRAREARKAYEVKRPKQIYIEDKRVQNITLSPDENYVTFILQQSPKGVKRTVVPDYMTETGFTRDLPGRAKVGSPQSSYEFGIYDSQNDTVYFVSTGDIPGIFEQPKYLDEYKKETVADTSDTTKVKKKSKKKKPRGVYFQGPVWSADGKRAAVAILSQDNKDRWIMSLDVATGKVSLIDRQHDEAWIGGPGISGWRFCDHIPSNRGSFISWQTSPARTPRQITHSLRDELKSYPWRDAEVITFKARDGAKVYARLYRPENPHPDRPAVIFVHGAGYLQNAHKWWSSYFREYMILLI